MSHPAHIDRFRVVRLIGSGGMGHVYEAVDPEIQRRVALKVLRRDLLSDNPELLQRLFVEARAANAIGHPGVVQISEAKLLPEGSGYLVMELLEGVTLTQRLRRAGGRLQPADALPLAIQIASALRAGHQRGIVHRDLKPDNIMLVADDAVASGERVKLLDFGIAKLVHDAASDAPLTLADMGLGTPGYMAPEQIRGAADASDRCDVYGLGAVLFEMLSGRRPHVAGNTADLVVQVLSVDAPHIDTLVTGLPRSLDPLLAQMLLREPAEARPDMSAVLRQLVLAGSVSSAAAVTITSVVESALTQAEPSVFVSPPRLQSIGDLAPSGSLDEGNGAAANTSAESIAAPAAPSSSTDSQMIGQRPPTAAALPPTRSLLWRLTGAAVAVGVVPLIALLWSQKPQRIVPPGAHPVDGFHSQLFARPAPQVVVSEPGSGGSSGALSPTPPSSKPAIVALLPSKPPKAPSHLGCIGQQPRKILPTDAVLIAAVKDAIRTYKLLLCNNEKLVLIPNKGDSSLSFQTLPRSLRRNPDFNAEMFAQRIQGRLAASAGRRVQFDKIVISN